MTTNSKDTDKITVFSLSALVSSSFFNNASFDASEVTKAYLFTFFLLLNILKIIKLY